MTKILPYIYKSFVGWYDVVLFETHAKLLAYGIIYGTYLRDDALASFKNGINKSRYKNNSNY